MKLKTIILFALFIVFGLNIKADKLEGLRTNKKIVRMKYVQEPYFAIQIVALRLPPQMAEFFHNAEVVREYACTDGYVRYCLGQFNTYEAAKAAINAVKAKGYRQAFVVNTNEYLLEGNSADSATNEKEIDPDKIYTVQLSAFRFPVYLSHFKDVDNVMEFRMKDKVFRYTTGQFEGRIAEEQLAKIKALGYKDAHLVELDLYLPFKIE